MDIKAQALYSQMQALAAQAGPGVENTVNETQVANPSSANFGDMLKDALDNVNDMQFESRALQKQFEMGDPNVSLADVMVAKEKSGIAFEATMQVRNKVLEAYKTIMNMPI